MIETDEEEAPIWWERLGMGMLWLLVSIVRVIRGSFHRRKMPPRKPGEPTRGLWGRERFDREFLNQFWGFLPKCIFHINSSE